MSTKHPDTPGGGTVDEELNDSTRPQMDELGQPRLDQDLDGGDRRELGDETEAGQNSDWLPQ